MNAITHTETQAVATALETAAPAQNLLLVPLSRLRPSRRNVRKTAGQCIDALAASITRVGCCKTSPSFLPVMASITKSWSVAALTLLAKKHHIPKGWEVPCLLVRDACVRTVSLAESVRREAMQPADQFESPYWWPKTDPSKTFRLILRSRRW